MTRPDRSFDLLSRPDITKLGPKIHGFHIPAELTCPGATEVCLSTCFGLLGHFRMPNVAEASARNKRRTESAEFVTDMVSEIMRKMADVVRTHVVGDFYDAPYVRKWIAVAEQRPRTQFFAYTRSWRKPRMVQALTAFAALPNVELWLSSDRQTGPALAIPHTREAFMLRVPGDEALVPDEADLVFRNRRRDWAPMKKLNGVQVCPEEDGIERKLPINCSRCSICWKGARGKSNVEADQTPAGEELVALELAMA